MIPTIVRGAGVVLPVSALPGRYGIGDFSAAERWLTWLESAGQAYWQILPLLMPDSVGSPFASTSGFALNRLLVSPDWLRADGWVSAADVRRSKLGHRHISWSKLVPVNHRLWQVAWRNWQLKATPADQTDLWRWRKLHAAWLEPYTAYQAIKDAHGGQPWWEWPKQWQDGRQAVKNLTPDLQVAVEFQTFSQWVLDRQWQRVRQAAKRHRVTIIGDLPFYVQYDSVEVWTRPELFLLDAKRRMKVVSGSWPDLFSHRGQKWGTPVYRWAAHRREHWAWWSERIIAGKRLYDLIRFDHFAGLQATWHVPITAKDGTVGHWSTTPGAELLRAIERRLGHLPFIAEDLGRVSQEVIKLRQHVGVPGSRVLQFAWSGLPNNLHDPTFVQRDVVFYTANHDTNTTNGWLRGEAKWYEKLHLRETYGNTQQLHWKFITTAYRHRAVVALVHIADLFGYGSAARINHPGTTRGNWTWRLAQWPAPALARRLRTLARQTKRLRRGRS